MVKGRSPCIWWRGVDLILFFARAIGYGINNLKLGLYQPIPHMKGQLALADPEVMNALGLTEEQAKEMVKSNPVELTLRDIVTNALIMSANESRPCPPPENCC